MDSHRDRDIHDRSRDFGIGGRRSRSLLLQSCVNFKKDRGAIA
ncbi:hypothetical protein M595_3318 [Lyngbya aestuarii BL J]|uniref:Uncharacterized protein n=1 Tax=Lyngbya aestuarii BL J TaxID=1348334 RepID=U7QFH3_9CYAN|nr:hypothetical protein [Lyngbya aestuarii]ERT06699.1 hypothetical protein M595_3318 [Lyngbya aestuarii BL J]